MQGKLRQTMQINSYENKEIENQIFYHYDIIYEKIKKFFKFYLLYKKYNINLKNRNDQ